MYAFRKIDAVTMTLPNNFNLDFHQRDRQKSRVHTTPERNRKKAKNIVEITMQGSISGHPRCSLCNVLLVTPSRDPGVGGVKKSIATEICIKSISQICFIHYKQSSLKVRASPFHEGNHFF